MTLSDLLTLTPVAPGVWTAPGAPPTNERVVFGGLVVAQAVLAASVDTRPLHSLHAFFIGGGEKERPFEIHVERSRDGGSFSTRHVEIHQGERLLLAAYTSHHEGDQGPEHQVTMPKVTAPEKLEDFSLARRRRDEQAGRVPRHYIADQLLDVRHVEESNFLPHSDATMAVWFRCRDQVVGDHAMHQAAIAFASDVPLVHVGLKHHWQPGGPPMQTASLDHSLWFHRDAQADEWLLYTLDSPIVRNGRGLSRGMIFNRDGQLVASVAQEFLARSNRPRPAQAIPGPTESSMTTLEENKR